MRLRVDIATHINPDNTEGLLCPGVIVADHNNLFVVTDYDRRPTELPGVKVRRLEGHNHPQELKLVWTTDIVLEGPEAVAS